MQVGQHNSRLLFNAEPRLLALCTSKQAEMMSCWACTCTGYIGCLALLGLVGILLVIPDAVPHPGWQGCSCDGKGCRLHRQGYLLV